ncbi:MAG: hypothetical protein ABR964_13205 [Tepidisphaeraceae bacterium]|jgi:Spy/CpxP family protein refolding chaperone
MRKQIIFIVTAVLVLVAGLAIGWVTAPYSPGFIFPRHHRSWVADQLNLTTQQHQQMDAIWVPMQQKWAEMSDRRRSLSHERDEAIVHLLNDQQRAAYDKILDDYHAKRDALDKDRQALMHDAVQRSRALLDDSQKAKWDELTKDIHEHRGPWGPATVRSTTRPAGAGGA